MINERLFVKNERNYAIFYYKILGIQRLHTHLVDHLTWLQLPRFSQRQIRTATKTNHNNYNLDSFRHNRSSAYIAKT